MGVVWSAVQHGSSVGAAVRPSFAFSAGHLHILFLPEQLRVQGISGTAEVAY